MVERLKHLVDSRELGRDWLVDVFAKAQKLKNSGPSGHAERRLVYLSFHTPSNITKSQFVAAIERLSWGMFDRDPAHSTWGKNLENEAKVANLQGYDVVVFRGSEAGEARQMAQFSCVPVINAGEGFDGIRLLYFPQHTSQGITDTNTIYGQFRDLDGLRITLTGDTRDNPVVNALLCTLANFKTEIFLTSGYGTNSLHESVEAFLEKRKIPIRRTGSLGDVLPKTDVLYIAHSRHTKRADMPGAYIDSITTADLERLPDHAVIMHDMIRGVLPEADGAQTNPKLIYEQQIKNGVYGSMAMLEAVVER